MKDKWEESRNEKIFKNIIFNSRREGGASFSVTERVTEIDYFMSFMVNCLSYKTLICQCLSNSTI